MWKRRYTHDRDAATLPRHNGGITRAMLAGVPLTPKPGHKPRGGYHVERQFAQPSKPTRIRKNSERDVVPPVEPLPAPRAPASPPPGIAVFDAIARGLTDDSVSLWSSRRDMEARRRRSDTAMRRLTIIERPAPPC
ncbi:hypothetical protein [Cupriavidus sp.]|nr:hypothetical protein [Cupriavidus sp.]MCA3187901.1 hypothetical protein [Cupriavidus sp.]MCA3189448.1 hypothetical protein [Cupriavidus sp.]MCA3195528.1 hypothetical protein [Cupriavidus sp.]MCA3201083.1 hypothetical protein [Cupriavidus sp.]MCA3207903.1 hypothetical protein [Cupriavidus sp.]